MRSRSIVSHLYTWPCRRRCFAIIEVAINILPVGSIIEVNILWINDLIFMHLGHSSAVCSVNIVAVVDKLHVSSYLISITIQENDLSRSSCLGAIISPLEDILSRNTLTYKRQLFIDSIIPCTSILNYRTNLVIPYIYGCCRIGCLQETGDFISLAQFRNISLHLLVSDRTCFCLAFLVGCTPSDSDILTIGNISTYSKLLGCSKSLFSTIIHLNPGRNSIQRSSCHGERFIREGCTVSRIENHLRSQHDRTSIIDDSNTRLANMARDCRSIDGENTTAYHILISTRLEPLAVASTIGYSHVTVRTTSQHDNSTTLTNLSTNAITFYIIVWLAGTNVVHVVYLSYFSIFEVNASLITKFDIILCLLERTGEIKSCSTIITSYDCIRTVDNILAFIL